MSTITRERLMPTSSEANPSDMRELLQVLPRQVENTIRDMDLVQDASTLIGTPIKSISSSAGSVAVRQSPIMDLSRATFAEPDDPFRALQQWVGYVVGIDEETFQAQLKPLIGEGGDQYAEIYLSELDDEERKLVVEGAVFYWTIGYHETASGRRNESVIRFRRLPPPTEIEMQRAAAVAKEWLELFE